MRQYLKPDFRGCGWFSGLLALLLVSSAVAETDAALGIELEPLTSRYGYLVVDTDVASKVLNWKLSNGYTVDSLPFGRNLQLMRLRAGSYQWRQLQVPYFNLANVVSTKEDERWGFRIERGKLNYAGSLIVGELRGPRSVDVRFVNRSAEVLGLIRERFPQLYRQHGLIYTGNGADTFLDLIQNDAIPAPTQ